MSSLNRKKILIQMTGSIACFKACALISKLVQSGYHVKVAASPSALQFVGVATLEGLTGEKVMNDLWEKGEAMTHIQLMRWADLIAVIPATAHYINRVAHGIGDDLLTTMFLAHDFKKPFLIAPAMNTSMYLHPTTQKSIRSLKEMGVEILEAASGVLACGEVGFGRLLEPDLLMQQIELRLLEKSELDLPNQGELRLTTQKSSPSDSELQNKISARTLPKVLLTAGGTQEPIDGVRVISNLSTGSTGAQLADQLESLGFSVVFMHAQNSKLPMLDCEKISFQTSGELREALHLRLSKGDIGAVIHMAAVSDFVLQSWMQTGVAHTAESQGKISSSEDLALFLKKNPKILPLIQSFSPRPLHITAFKMTSGASPEQRRKAVEKIFHEAVPQWVVHNDTTEIDRTKGIHFMNLYKDAKSSPLALQSVMELTEQFVQEYQQHLTQGSCVSEFPAPKGIV